MHIGNLELNRPLALAPMEDVTDIPFRLVCKNLGADLVYTEFTSSEALIRDAKKALHKIHVVEEERPVAIQIFGGNDTSMEGAAAIAEAAGPDFIDVNCGCWVKKVVRREEGAGLLRNLGKFEAVVRSVIRGTSLPVTVKTRLGWDANNIVIMEVARMLEQLGIHALAVHCRTRDQGHSGNADWSWLERLKNTVSIPIIGNGDINAPEDVKRMLETGCDGVMIGRGAIQNPWIFRETKHYLETGEILPPATIRERVDLCIEHLRYSVLMHEELWAVRNFRKFYAGYLKGQPHVAKLRAEIMALDTFDEVAERLEQYADECCVEVAA